MLPLRIARALGAALLSTPFLLIAAAADGGTAGPPALAVSDGGAVPHASAADRGGADPHAGAVDRDAAITLARARALALERSPALGAASAEVRAQDGRVVQAGLVPNPQLGTEVEDFAGSGSRSGFHEAQTTLRLGQLVELGGKRGKRVESARLERDVAAWDLEQRRVEVVADATKAFVRALAAERRAEVAAEIEAATRRGAGMIDDQVRAGAAAPADATRARLAVDRAALERDLARRDAEAARRALAATWGDTSATAPEVRGDLFELEELPALASLEERLGRSPALARWDSEYARSRAQLAVETAARVPDVTLGLGMRYYREGDDAAVVADASVPLPLFHRNQGSIAEATQRVEKARLEGADARREAVAALHASYARLARFRAEARTLRDSLVPRARQALDETSASYRAGGARVLDLLDAWRTLLVARRDAVAALESFHLEAAEIERLTSPPIVAAGPTENAR